MALNARFAMTPPQVPLVMQGGLSQQDWYVLLYNLYLAATEGLPQPEQDIDLGASPFAYQGVIRGQLHIGGGTVTAVEFSRDGTTYYDTGIVEGFVQMDARDHARVTFAVAPTLTFFPM